MDSYIDFKQKLDQEHQWPTIYMFKFVVPSGKVEEFHSVFDTESLQSKKSKGGNYASFTIKKMMSSSQEVVDVYLKAKKIEGIIAL
jgi:putative lipoic acid-binding regulatory protein